MTSDWTEYIPTGDGIDIHVDESMSLHTTYKVGGAARVFIRLGTLDALSTLLAFFSTHSVPFVVVGNGSNVLFADNGFEGAVIQLGKGFDTISHSTSSENDNGLLRVGAAVSITRLIRYVKQERLSGVEYLGGVPGTVGGAVRMNAGTVMGEVSDTLLRVRIVTPAGPAQWIESADLRLSYRHSELPPNSVVIEAEFACRPAVEETFQKLDRVLRYRKETQPLRLPSCGSVFANPPGDYAGRLIEACGLKGECIGGAQVSKQHANWIVNIDKATANDIHALMQLCVDKVEANFGVHLRHEVQFLGDWNEA